MSSKVSSATEQAPKTSPQLPEQPSIQKISRKPLKKAKGVEKSASAFRTISEVANELKVEQHVLRFWESKFSQIAPLKRGGGRRYYRPEDVELLKNIHHLLYQEGYTIKGVQKLLHSTRGNLTGRVADAKAPVVEETAPVASSKKKEELQSMLKELKSMRNLIG
jgi:DNA-binding transcriptional MerR regulator